LKTPSRFDLLRSQKAQFHTALAALTGMSLNLLLMRIWRKWHFPLLSSRWLHRNF